MNEQNKIGVIGERDSVLGFMAIGFGVFTVDTPEEGAKALKKAADGGYAVIYITEDLAIQLEEDIARYKDVPLPAVIVIPGKDGSGGYGLTNIRKSVERAVGADILFKENS